MEINTKIITTQKDVFNLIKTLTGQANVLTIPVAFIKYTGNIHSGLFLSQLIYWTEKTDDGWIYKTYNDWENEIYIKEYSIRKAKKILEEKDILETKVKKISGNPTVHYRLKWERFLDSFLCFLSNVNAKSKEPKCEIKGTYNKAEITSKITTDIYSTFLKNWKKNSLIQHNKITSKRKKAIDKILKENDYPLEEIFKAFQNYSIVLNSDDYFWDYKWSMEDFLQRGLNKFVDEAEPLENFKNRQTSFGFNSKQQFEKQPKIHPTTPTKESMNLLTKDPMPIGYPARKEGESDKELIKRYRMNDIDKWISVYDNCINKLINANIWKQGYKPDKDKIYSRLLTWKTWTNNLFRYNTKIKDAVGHLINLVDAFIEYTEYELDREEPWFTDGITESHLLINGNFFINFIQDLGVRLGPYEEGEVIRSRGWNNDQDQKIENVAEIELRWEKEAKEQEKKDQEHERWEKKQKENTEFMHDCMKKHLADIDKTDINNLDLSELLRKKISKQDFEAFVIEIEKQHQANPGNRGYGYIPLWRKEVEKL